MKRIPYFLSLCLLIISSCQSEKANNSIITEVGEWQTIFNGKNLDGWETMGKLTTDIKEGALHIHATDPNNNAWIYTQKSYQNF